MAASANEQAAAQRVHAAARALSEAIEQAVQLGLEVEVASLDVSTQEMRGPLTIVQCRVRRRAEVWEEL